ncbi:hypothetical protein Hanom_Chr04g00351461 [Helianthus anomalus]
MYVLIVMGHTGVGEGCHIESLGTLAMVPWISFQEVCCSPQRKRLCSSSVIVFL